MDKERMVDVQLWGAFAGLTDDRRRRLGTLLMMLYSADEAEREVSHAFLDLAPESVSGGNLAGRFIMPACVLGVVQLLDQMQLLGEQECARIKQGYLNSLPAGSEAQLLGYRTLVEQALASVRNTRGGLAPAPHAVAGLFDLTAGGVIVSSTCYFTTSHTLHDATAHKGVTIFVSGTSYFRVAAYKYAQSLASTHATGTALSMLRHRQTW
jgi:hypothetical protein